MKRPTEQPAETDILIKLKWRGDAALRDLWQITTDMRLYADTLQRERFGLADADRALQ